MRAGINVNVMGHHLLHDDIFEFHEKACPCATLQETWICVNILPGHFYYIYSKGIFYKFNF